METKRLNDLQTNSDRKLRWREISSPIHSNLSDVPVWPELTQHSDKQSIFFNLYKLWIYIGYEYAHQRVKGHQRVKVDTIY